MTCFRRLLHCLFLAIALSPSGLARASNCLKCQNLIAQLQKQQQAKEQTVLLLGRNQSYLAMMSENEASKFLKVSSNIKMILGKLDRIKQERSRLERDTEQEGCDECPRSKSG